LHRDERRRGRPGRSAGAWMGGGCRPSTEHLRFRGPAQYGRTDSAGARANCPVEWARNSHQPTIAVHREPCALQDQAKTKFDPATASRPRRAKLLPLPGAPASVCAPRQTNRTRSFHHERNPGKSRSHHRREQRHRRSDRAAACAARCQGGARCAAHRPPGGARGRNRGHGRHRQLPAARRHAPARHGSLCRVRPRDARADRRAGQRRWRDADVAAVEPQDRGVGTHDRREPARRAARHRGRAADDAGAGLGPHRERGAGGHAGCVAKPRPCTTARSTR
jgi:hypothetical protein